MYNYERVMLELLRGDNYPLSIIHCQLSIINYQLFLAF